MGPGGPGQPRGQGQSGGPPGPGGPEGQGFGPIEPPAFQRQQPPQNPPRGLDTEGFRIANLRRPRHFNVKIESLSQPGDVPFDLKAVNAVIRGKSPIYTSGSFEGERIRVFTMPWLEGNEVRAVVQVARETRDLDRLWQSQTLTLVIFLPCALVVAALGAIFLTNRAMRPIGTMRDAATAISGTNLSERIPIQGQDEFAELGESFNSMIGRLEKAFTDLQLAFEQQRRFTADASHELRTPLTRMKLSTSAALEPGANEADRLEALRVADEATEGMNRLVNQLLLLARADAGQLAFQRERSDLRVIVSEAIEQVLKPDSIELNVDFPDRAVYAEVDPEAMRRVFINLLENAYRHAMEGKVAVAIRDEKSPEVVVADTGEGIAPEHLVHLTERFYRVDSSRTGGTGGSGLGLAICKTIVEGHGASLKIESKPGEGTQVSVLFSEKTS
ncbi:MAG: HAMP domain-containing protein [Chlorobia bacterium]|nr:HAMP domain-containing protein [Fimbriimonadaceae bacterium]